MTLKKASNFLFIAAIIALSGKFLQNLSITYSFGTGWFRGAYGLKSLMEMAAIGVFVAIGATYRNHKFDVAKRNTAGLFLAIVGGISFMLQGYSLPNILRFILSQGESLFYLAQNVIALFLAAVFVILGIALFSANQNSIRIGVLLLMLAAGAETLQLLYHEFMQLTGYGMGNTAMDLLLQSISLIVIVFPVALFFWALAMYRKPVAGKL